MRSEFDQQWHGRRSANGYSPAEVHHGAIMTVCDGKISLEVNRYYLTLLTAYRDAL